MLTRTRQCNGKQEISVLDYVFVTSDIHEQVRSMEIDEKNFVTPWRKLRKGRRFSDHPAIKLSLNLEFSKSPKRAKKLVVWNFDDPLNWKSFHQRTKISDDLQKAWKTKNNVEACYKQWKHSLNSILHECFPKKKLISNKQVYNKEIRQDILRIGKT